MKTMFVECYSIKDKNKLIQNGFTFLEKLSSSEKFIFMNDGNFNFSNNEVNVKFHNRANV